MKVQFCVDFLWIGILKISQKITPSDSWFPGNFLFIMRYPWETRIVNLHITILTIHGSILYYVHRGRRWGK